MQEMECPSAAQDKGAQAPVNDQRSLMRLGCGSVAEQLPSRQRPWAPSAAKWGRERKIEEEQGGEGKKKGGKEEERVKERGRRRKGGGKKGRDRGRKGER